MVLQALEWRKNTLQKVCFYSGSVIPHRKEPVFRLPGRANVYARRRLAAMGQSARGLGHVDAATRVAQLVDDHAR